MVRILVSETDEWLAEMIAELVHAAAKLGISVATITPPTIRQDDLLETAAKQNFDGGVLLLNNIFYPPYDLRSREASLRSDSIALVATMTRLFKKPIIALYGWGDDEYSADVVQAGAEAAIRIPCAREELQEELKRLVML